ncbi:hypothetical protein L208DRAFT_1408457 [Tricholoma matsutake]|nr:hypothetical protein L208DRAFT_1408457 [Tricholoma matsutake 945]
MSDGACGICLVFCCDILAGICFDFISIRHACTENLCRCKLSHSGDHTDAGEGERQQLISEGPRSHPPMQLTSP